jgi:hypothetical protein
MESDIQLFINEYSLQEQFYDVSDFENAVITLSLMINSIREKEISNPLYKSELFESYNAFRGQHFQSSLKRISEADVRENFKRIIFDKHNPINWQTDQKHNSTEDLFSFKEDIVTGTSMAELAERKLLNTELKGALLNFINSSLPNEEPALVLKNEEEEIFLDSFDQQESFDKWLEKIFPSVSTDTEYSIDSTDPPKDEQTILRDASRFTQTNKCCQGRQIYKELTTGRFWYVDNEHFGRAAHLEVYDKRRNHIGKASLEGDLKPDTKKRKKPRRNIKDLI